MKTPMRTQIKRNKQWMRNRDQLKNPKVFSMKAIRQPDGSFVIIGGETRVLERKNQYAARWVNVDTRDFATELRRSRIIAL
jgi:Trm5-related predicted tRNA methylase